MARSTQSPVRKQVSRRKPTSAYDDPRSDVGVETLREKIENGTFVTDVEFSETGVDAVPVVVTASIDATRAVGEGIVFTTLAQRTHSGYIPMEAKKLGHLPDDELPSKEGSVVVALVKAIARIYDTRRKDVFAVSGLTVYQGEQALQSILTETVYGDKEYVGRTRLWPAEDFNSDYHDLKTWQGNFITHERLFEELQ